MNVLRLKDIEKIYEMTRSRWVPVYELLHIGRQLKFSYIEPMAHLEFDTPDQVPVHELVYDILVKDHRTYEDGREEYLVEFLDW